MTADKKYLIHCKFEEKCVTKYINDNKIVCTHLLEDVLIITTDSNYEFYKM